MTVQMLKSADIGDSDFSVARGKQIYQGLVKLPILPGACTSGTAGGSNASANSAGLTNADGSATFWSLTAVPITAGGVQGGAWVETTLYGPRVGVRFRRNNSASLAPFTVWVDGVPYAVRKTATRRHAATVVATTDSDSLFLTSDDIGSGPHTVRVSLAGAPIGGASRTLVIYGWVVDAVAGYAPPSRGAGVPTTVTSLTNVAATIPTQNANGRVRKVFLYNTDSSARTVTFTLSGATIKVVYLAAAGTTGDSAEVDFGESIQMMSALKWQASVTSVVNGLVEEIIT